MMEHAQQACGGHDDMAAMGGPDLGAMIAEAKDRKGKTGKSKAKPALLKTQKSKSKSKLEASSSEYGDSGSDSSAEAKEVKSESDGEGDLSDEQGQQGDKKAKKAKKDKDNKGDDKWYDAETQNLKAEKDFDRAVQVLKGNMDAQVTAMTAVVREFRADSRQQRCQGRCCQAKSQSVPVVPIPLCLTALQEGSCKSRHRFALATSVPVSRASLSTSSEQ